MKHAFRLRRLIALVAVTLTVVTSAFLASATAASAATSAGQTTSTGASQAPDFVHACGAKMTKGRYSCFAMKRTDIKHSLMLGPGDTYGLTGNRKYRWENAWNKKTVFVVVNSSHFYV